MELNPRWRIGLLGLLVGCSRDHTWFEKYPVGVLPHTSTRQTYYTVSADGAHLAVIRNTLEGQRAVEGDRVGDPYPRVAQVHYIGETNQLYYYGIEGTDPADPSEVTLVAGGRSVRSISRRRGVLVTSRDGLKWALASHEADPEPDTPPRVVIQAGDGTIHRWADTTVPAFTPDGQHLTYFAEDAAGKFHLVEDAMILRTLEAPAGKCAPLLKPTSEYPTLSPQFFAAHMPTGERVTLARDRDCWTLMLGDRRLAAYTTLVPGKKFDLVVISPDYAHDATMLADPLSFASEAPRVFWWERFPGIVDSWRLMANGEPVDERTCSRFWDDAPIVVSPDGRHTLYPCYQPAPAPSLYDDLLVTHGPRTYGPYKFVFGMAITRDGEHAAWAAAGEAEGEDWYFYLDGRKIEPGFTNAFPVVFSPNGSHVAWTGRRDDRAWLVRDGRTIAHVDEVLRAPQITDTGEMMAVIRRGRRVTRLVLRRGQQRRFF